MTKRSRQARPIAPPLNFSTANRPPPGSRIATPSVNNNHLLFFSCSPCYLVSFFLFVDRQPDLGPHFAIHVPTRLYRLFTYHSIVHRGNRRRDLSRDPLAIKRLRNLVDLWRSTGWSGGYTETRIEGVWRRSVRLASFLPLPFSFFFSSILDFTFVLSVAQSVSALSASNSPLPMTEIHLGVVNISVKSGRNCVKIKWIDDNEFSYFPAFKFKLANICSFSVWNSMSFNTSINRFSIVWKGAMRHFRVCFDLKSALNLILQNSTCERKGRTQNGTTILEKNTAHHCTIYVL